MLDRIKSFTEKKFIEYDVVSDCVNPETGEKLLTGKETGLLRFTKFRNTEFDYDADSSIESISVAKEIYPFAQDAEIIKQGGEYNADGLLYELQSGEKAYRADTMNSAATTLRQYRLTIGKDKEIPAIADDFLKLYHTIGNFNLLPYRQGFSLNGPRGIGVSHDYFDLFLLAIYNYCNDFEENVVWTLTRIFGDKSKTEYYKRWLDETFNAEGKSKWETFVSQNFLEDYLDEEGAPKELWTGHFAGGVMPETEREFHEFWTNAADLIRKRSKRIYEALQET